MRVTAPWLQGRRSPAGLRRSRKRRKLHWKTPSRQRPTRTLLRPSAPSGTAQDRVRGAASPALPAVVARKTRPGVDWDLRDHPRPDHPGPSASGLRLTAGRTTTQPQARRGVVARHRQDSGPVEGGQAHGHCVVLVGLAAVSAGAAGLGAARHRGILQLPTLLVPPAGEGRQLVIARRRCWRTGRSRSPSWSPGPARPRYCWLVRVDRDHHAIAHVILLAGQGPHLARKGNATSGRADHSGAWPGAPSASGPMSRCCRCR